MMAMTVGAFWEDKSLSLRFHVSQVTEAVSSARDGPSTKPAATHEVDCVSPPKFPWGSSTPVPCDVRM